MSPAPGPQFDNSYVRLPANFYTQQPPTPVAAPRLIRYNSALAAELGIAEAWLQSEEATLVLAGNRIAPGSQPIATVYAGHQFGGWNPQLGDGRAVLLGEVVDTHGCRRDIQLKGAGRTRYSRGGDGRSPLGPVLREYIVSEAMAALGVPTTRSLAAIATGERVYREHALPGGILTRVASSHIRIGTFQYFWSREDTASVRLLADHVIDRHYPAARLADRPYLALLEAVIERQARLIARWLELGFVHGVMNTDNMLLSGETVDYGPCAFIDRFDPAAVFSSIDTRGRYAYGNQAGIAQWNLAWLAQALLPLIDDDEKKGLQLAQEAIGGFSTQFEDAHEAGLHRKLGLAHIDDTSKALCTELLEQMAATGADFTLTFRRLAELAGDKKEDGGDSTATIHSLPAELDGWIERWRTRFHQEPAPRERQAAMLAANPVYIPRNHLIEAAIRAAEDRDDFAPFHRLVDRLADPCRYDPAHAAYALPPQPGEEVTRTFCGT